MRSCGRKRGASVWLALVALALSFSGHAAAEKVPVDESSTRWKAVAASGRVEARPVDTAEPDWIRVGRGDAFPAETAVRTGRRGRVTLAHRASLLIVDPSSEVFLPVSAGPAGPTEVIQNSGTVLYEVDGKLHRGFKVVTPTLVSGVKGTVFMVTVNDRYTSVSVEQGRVEVTDLRTGEQHEVDQGQVIFRESDLRQIEVVELEDRRARHEAHRLAKLEQRRNFEREDVMPSDSMHEDSPRLVRDETVRVGEIVGLVSDSERERDEQDEEDLSDELAEVREQDDDLEYDDHRFDDPGLETEGDASSGDGRDDGLSDLSDGGTP